MCIEHIQTAKYILCTLDIYQHSYADHHQGCNAVGSCMCMIQECLYRCGCIHHCQFGIHQCLNVTKFMHMIKFIHLITYSSIV